MSDDDTGDAIDTVKDVNAVASSGVLGQLLGPSAKILGVKLEQRVKRWTGDVEDKAHKNVADQVSAVQKKIPDLELGSDPATAKMLDDWMIEAQKFDEQDEVSALWQGIFAAIAKGETDESLIIEKARYLNEHDLRVLKSIAEDKVPFDGMGSQEKLEDLQLVRSLDYLNWRIIIPYSMIAVLMWACYAAWVSIALQGESSWSPTEAWTQALGPVAVPMTTFIVGGFIYMTYNIIQRAPVHWSRKFRVVGPELTFLGEQVLVRYKQFADLQE